MSVQKRLVYSVKNELLMFAGTTKCGRVVFFEAKGEKLPNNMKKLSEWDVKSQMKLFFFFLLLK